MPVAMVAADGWKDGSQMPEDLDTYQPPDDDAWADLISPRVMWPTPCASDARPIFPHMTASERRARGEQVMLTHAVNETIGREGEGRQLALAIQETGADASLAHIRETVEAAIAATTSVLETKQIDDQLAALRKLAQRSHATFAQLLVVAMLRLQCVRRGGELLRAIRRAVGGRPGNSSQAETSFQAAVQAAGLSRATAYRWQAVATVPDGPFRRWFDCRAADGQEPTLANLERLAAEMFSRQKTERRALSCGPDVEDAPRESVLPRREIPESSAFPQVDMDIETQYHCPACGYEWSGSPKPNQPKRARTCLPSSAQARGEDRERQGSGV
jgi:hypothetical protein